MSKFLMLLGGWLALNAVLAAALLNRRSVPHLRERLFRWVVEDAKTSRLGEEVQHRGYDR